MARPDLIAYLHAHLNDFPLDELKKQLISEGVTEAEFNAALTTTQTRRRKTRARVLLGRLLLVGGLALVGVAVLVSMQEKPKVPADEPGTPRPQATTSTGTESAFLGKSGYVLKLPKDYVAVSQPLQGGAPDEESVHFCRAGTDPSNFLNEGLYGQLGIVRLRVLRSRYAGQINGLEALSRELAARSQARGEKYALKNLQISGLRGIQVTYEAPDARVETYVLGQNVLYFFMAGQDDEIYRAIIQSLRDAQSET